MFSWIKNIFLATAGTTRGRCPGCGVINSAGATACAACRRSLSLPPGAGDTWWEKEQEEADRQAATAAASFAQPTPALTVENFGPVTVVTFLVDTLGPDGQDEPESKQMLDRVSEVFGKVDAVCRQASGVVLLDFAQVNKMGAAAAVALTRLAISAAKEGKDVAVCHLPEPWGYVLNEHEALGGPAFLRTFPSRLNAILGLWPTTSSDVLLEMQFTCSECSTQFPLVQAMLEGPRGPVFVCPGCKKVLYQSKFRKTSSTEIMFLHPGFRKGWIVKFEKVFDLFHVLTLFQHVFSKRAELPSAKVDRPTTVEDAQTRREMMQDWPGPEPHPSAEATRIPASHLGGCVHPNTWAYCPWFALQSGGLFPDLFIGGDHAPEEIPQFEGHRIILLGRAQGLRTWMIDLPEEVVAQVRVLRTLSIEEVDSWCERLIKANAELQLEGKVGCAICTHPLATLERSAEPTAPADGGRDPGS